MAASAQARKPPCSKEEEKGEKKNKNKKKQKKRVDKITTQKWLV